jgi:hypothetical protein
MIYAKTIQYKKLGARPTTSPAPFCRTTDLPLPHEATLTIPHIVIVAVFIRATIIFILVVLVIVVLIIGSELRVERLFIDLLKVFDNLVA